MKRLLFILNPRSGKEQIRNKLLDILDVFTKGGFFVSVHVTQSQGDAKKTASLYGEEYDMIAVSGGDGTLNEVISGIMLLEQKKRPKIGYIPAGSTNDFASSLEISKNMKQAAYDIVKGREFAVDVGSFGTDQYFMYIAAFGAFTEVSYMTPQEIKNILGHQAYMLEAVKRISNLKAYRMKLQWDQGELDEEFILGMVTNTTSVAGFKGLIGREVSLNDGEFEVLFVRNPKTPKDIAEIAWYFLTKEGENNNVYYFRTKSLSIISEDRADWSLDGEYGGSPETIEIRNLRQAVKIQKSMGEIL